MHEQAVIEDYDSVDRLLDDSALRPKTRSVLKLLYKHRGSIVNKEEILETVWSDVIVTGDSLVQCISEIRSEICEHPSIELKTFAKRGYMLSVSDEVLGLKGVSEISHLPSIAVLPFVNLADKEGEAFAFGLTEDVINELSRHRDILVMALDTTQRYNADNDKSGAAADELGVRYVLRGNVQLAGPMARVNVQFIDARSGSLIWSERYMNNIESLFEAQDDISAAVVNRIGGSDGVMISTERTRVKRSNTGNLRSYDRYVLGSNVALYLTKDGSEKACTHLEKAVEIDPLFVRAWCRLAALYLLQIVFSFTDDLEKAVEKFVQAALTAAEIDPEDSLALALAGGGWYMAGEPEKGKECFRRSLLMGPNLADSLALVAYLRPSKVDTAEEDFDNVNKAIKLNPFYPMWYSFAYGYSAFYAGEYESGIAELVKVHNQYFDKQLYLTLSYALLGDQQNMAKHKALLLEIRPDFSYRYIIQVDTICDPTALARFISAAKLAGLPE